MSTSYYTYIIYGIKVTKKIMTKTITKYNENTGKPYQKEIPSHTEIFNENGSSVYKDYNDDLYTEGSLPSYTDIIFLESDSRCYLGILLGKLSDWEDRECIINIPENKNKFFIDYNIKPEIICFVNINF